MKSILLHFFIFISFNFSYCSAVDLSTNHRLKKHDHYSYLIKKHLLISTNKNNFVSNNIYSTSKIDTVDSNTGTSTRQLKKWQVGRVSRKQYEVINMLWRKTKIFVNIEDYSTTTAYKHSMKNVTKHIRNQEPIYTVPHPILQPSTPSFIEFYYLDEMDDRIKRKDSTISKTNKLDDTFKYNRRLKNNQLGNLRFVLPSGPMFAFRANDPHYKPASVTQPSNNVRKKFQIRRLPLLDLRDYINFDLIPANKVDNNNKYISMNYATNTTEKSILDNSKDSDVNFINKKTDSLALNTTNGKELKNDTYCMSTANDKVKFFELYDKQTRIPDYTKKVVNIAYGEIYEEDTDKNEIIKSDQKILLKDVDQSSHDHDNNLQMKFVKKHIIESFAHNSNKTNDHKILNENLLSLSTLFNKTIIDNITAAKNAFMNQKMSTVKSLQMYGNESKAALWADYPFAAVYIHESAQVQCDAAAISPHWLVAAGSCLSRYQKSPAGQGRSAFVAYCGDRWWEPERVAYVKYSLVHPRFHPRDTTRRHLYNIGLIQVVSSMASSCTDWAPITLMSHQFSAEQDGSTAYALGWGLDRYDVQYSSPDLAKWPLMVYKGLIFSDYCPGNTDYSKVKRMQRGGVKNVYCLALPPYNGEKNDPVHGGILLVGEHLIALYLQEERRSWGEQSAQYTGTWRLTPWILDVAREPDEGESFMVDV